MIGQIHLKTKKYLYSPSSYIHKSLAEGGMGGGRGVSTLARLFTVI